MNEEDVRFNPDNMLEIELADDESFLKIKETLTRVGIAHATKKELYQSCHILHKRGKFYVVHFKELYGLDGRDSTFGYSDFLRRNTIASLLEGWGLLRIVKHPQESIEVIPKDEFNNFIKVISYKSKPKWELIPKYTFASERR